MNKPAWIRASALLGFLAVGATSAPAQAIVRGKPVHALALYGEPKYGPNDVFDFINPNAPKGGTLRLEASAQTFDSLNPFSMKGVGAAGLGFLGGNGMFVEGLSNSSDDEPFTQYCLLCETMEVAEDNSWIEFTLRPEARFHDGSPVTADDVIYSFQTLQEKGLPTYRLYWADIGKVEKTGPLKVKFYSKNPGNTELLLIIGQVPIISKVFWDAHDLSATTLAIPVSTGPYRIESFEQGRFIAYKRDPNYWGKDLIINRGTSNFDSVRFDYFRDDTVAFEAFKTGGFDLQYENSARRWATGYDFPAINDGRVTKLEVSSATPISAQGFTYNLRRSKFQDRRVRQALNYAFDFESMNRTIFYQQYVRLRSYWQRSDLEAKGLPSPAELALLEPLRGQIPPEVFTQEFTQPVTNGDGDARENLLKARTLLAEAGWSIVNGQLTNKQTGELFTFEVIEVSPTLDRVVLPWIQNLEKLGIKGSFRVIDSSQIVTRMNEFDFDVTTAAVRNGLSPGNEQSEYWSSEAAARPGSRNVGGVKDPAVDALIAAIVKAPDREALVAATRALDRVLTWNFFTGLQYGPNNERYAHWTKLQHPERFPLQGLPAPGWASVVSTWWMDPAAAATQVASSGSPGASKPGGEPQQSSKWWLTALLAAIALAAVIIAVRRRKA